MAENKDTNLIAIKSLIDCIDNRDIAEGGIFLDDDNAEFVADILRYHYKSLTSKNKMEHIASMFGKKLGERFTVNIRGTRYDARFLGRGFEVIGAENPYVDIDAYVLFDLLAGYAEVDDDEV